MSGDPETDEQAQDHPHQFVSGERAEVEQCRRQVPGSGCGWLGRSHALPACRSRPPGSTAAAGIKLALPNPGLAVALVRMSTERKSARRVAPVAEFCWLAAALWFVFGYIWPTLSPVEVPALQAMLDPRLFQHDFVVREYLRFNPRFYYNLLIYLPAAAGVPLPWVCALWQLIAVGVLVTGLRAIAKALGIGVIGAAILVVWALQVETGDLGLTYLYIDRKSTRLKSSHANNSYAVFCLEKKRKIKDERPLSNRETTQAEDMQRVPYV